GFANDGIAMGSPTLVAGMVGGALSFNGAGDFVQVSNHSDLNFGTGSFSVDCWINTTIDTQDQPIVDKRVIGLGSVRGYYLFVHNGMLACELADGTVQDYFGTSLPSVADGSWHFVAMTVKRTVTNGLTLYVDGYSETFDPTARSGSLTNSADLWIGARHPI